MDWFIGLSPGRRTGEPAHFRVPIIVDGEQVISFQIGCLSVGRGHPEQAWHPGVTADERRSAALRGCVFRIEDVDDGLSAMRLHGVRTVKDRVDVEICGRREIDALSFCADAMARAVLKRRTPMAGSYHLAMACFRRRIDPDVFMSPADAYEAIGAALAEAPDFHSNFGFPKEWAIEMRQRLAPNCAIMLHPADEDALVTLCGFRRE
jgi:hypothetical protein